jgi:hypothetical protein
VNPVTLTYGTPLADDVLSGAAAWTVGGAVVPIPGSWLFTSARGTVLNPGAGHSESVIFIPTNGTDYIDVTATVTINVLKATPTITWANPGEITYGTSLSAAQLNATASIPGTFVYHPGLGVVLPAGQGQSLLATFTPADTADYNAVTTTAKINVVGPVVEVVSFQPTRVKVTTGKGKGAKTKTESGLLLEFSGALTGIGDRAAYHLSTGKTKRGVTTYNKNVPFTVVNPTPTTVTLVPTRQLKPSVPEKLVVTESDLIDAFSRPLNGGQPFTDWYDNRTVTSAGVNSQNITGTP